MATETAFYLTFRFTRVALQLRLLTANCGVQHYHRFFIFTVIFTFIRLRTRLLYRSLSQPHSHLFRRRCFAGAHRSDSHKHCLTGETSHDESH